MNYLETIKGKIFPDAPQAKKIIDKWKSDGEKIVFTNGVFDILHRGHVELLSRAAGLGTKLIIGMNSDSSVTRIKGPSRPVQDENSRALLLASLEFTSMVILFTEDTPDNLIRSLKPDFLVKGGDYRAQEIVGYDFVTGYGGKVVIIPFVEGHSTTNILKRSGEK